jgi:hypothetical protein
VSHENVAEPSVNGPRPFTARHLAERVLSRGEVVPVRESPTASVRPRVRVRGLSFPWGCVW